MKTALAVLAALAALAACAAYPYVPKQATSPGAFIGEGINSIAAALLQDAEEQGAEAEGGAARSANAAFSPLGHSAILAAIAEGASGKTRAQMLAALKLPQDSSLTRATYRSVLSRMKEKGAVSKPEFRSWFYVYAKSIQLESAYTNVLKDSYLMEVRDIQALEEDTPEEFFIKKEDEDVAAVAPDAPPASVTPVAPVAPVAPIAPVSPEVPVVLPAELSEEEKKEPAMAEVMSKPIQEEEKKEEVMDELKKDDVKEEEKKEEIKEGMMEEEKKEVMKEEVMKEDEIKEEMKEEKKKEEMKEEMKDEEKKEEPAMLAVPVVQDAAEVAPAIMEEAVKPEIAVPEAAIMEEEILDAIKAEVPEKEAAPVAADMPAAPLQEDTAKVGEAGTSQQEEEVVAKPVMAEAEAEAEPVLENKITLAKFGKGGAKDEKKPTGDKKKDDRKKSRELAEDSNDRQPSSGPFLLTTFNALYYRGAWQVPFDAKFKDDFYAGDGRGETKEVTTLRTQGAFRIGDIKELNATAIELPYKGESGRYSLLVLLPRAQDGLPKMIKALSEYSFRYLAKNMREKQVDVAIPEFEIDYISHPQRAFKKLGMTCVFEKDRADLPGISKTQRLYLQDDAMAQLVRFKVDDKTAVANYLSAMSMSTRSGLNVFHANHPFVFYLRDNLDNLTILVGKVTDPTLRPDHSALDIPPGPVAEVPEAPESETPDVPADE